MKTRKQKEAHMKTKILAIVLLGASANAFATYHSHHGHHETKQVMHHDQEQNHHQQAMDHGDHGASPAGMPGKASEVSRSIEVEATDAMKFNHAPIEINAGETIKFIVRNSGQIPHEFSIGTKSEHKSHGEMMMKNPSMHHGPNSATITVTPGETEVLIWRFGMASKVEAACNIAGHYQAGMHSPISITKQ
jgi:uncharacterized cupredoxin-like copper-binding protein